MWAAFGRVCARRGISRTQRLRAMIASDVRRYGDSRDKADLAAALAELASRRSRKGARRRPSQDSPEQP
jgi:hypothetical protein